MKRILALAIGIASTYTAYSQSLNYNDLGVLFSKDDNYGTARFEAMSGAFGALGGDISSFGINPAGSAVAIKSTFGVTLGNRNTEYISNYYRNSTSTEDDFFNITQAGGILSFDSAFSSDWNRFALTFNYRIKKDFSGFHAAEGNSQYLIYNEHVADPKTIKTQFDRSLDQYNSSYIDGKSSVFSLGFSSVHQNKLYVGASLNFHDLEFYREHLFNEVNDDIDGNILDVENYTESYIQGTGFSIGLGFIYKLNQNIRFGLAYETPTWYQEVLEDYYDELLMKRVENLGIPEDFDVIGPESYLYKFKSPSRFTASGAYVIGKQGLISVDYTYKDFKNIKYSGGNFTNTNTNFSNDYRNTHALNIGTEWRFDNLSVRGGYHYEKDPNLLLGSNTNNDNVQGFSAGLGYNFGNMKIDLSYSKSNNNEYYTIYQNSDLNIENNTSRISGTVTFSL